MAPTVRQTNRPEKSLQNAKTDQRIQKRKRDVEDLQTIETAINDLVRVAMRANTEQPSLPQSFKPVVLDRSTDLV